MHLDLTTHGTLGVSPVPGIALKASNKQKYLVLSLRGNTTPSFAPTIVNLEIVVSSYLYALDIEHTPMYDYNV
jgi:hypothetical protein